MTPKRKKLTKEKIKGTAARKGEKMKVKICATIGVLGGATAALLGGWTTSLATLVAFMIKTAEELADEIINGVWGNNPERRENITAQYGADAYRAAQAIVDERLG